ncbi:hypothetical protein [Sorangium sp. So ce124]|uniref:hypothetical protein n=1 Tax=Sorangium sp. So ce124 TaxID=3133280 RepID=UPI003F6159A9
MSGEAIAAAHFVDANLQDFRAVGFGIDGDLNATNWAQARRAANEFCKGNGFLAGVLNGHQAGAMRGATCVDAANARFIDATLSELGQTGFPVSGNLDVVPWAQAARAANEFCKARGFLSGWMNGHQAGEMRGVVCVDATAASFIDALLADFRNVGWPIDDDVNALHWAQPARAANEFCKVRGYVGGFMNGHQAGLRRGVTCLR